MRFRLRSVLILIALTAILLGAYVHRRNQRNEAWANLQANGVHFSKQPTGPSAEIWVSTVDTNTFDVNGERLPKLEATNKLQRIRRELLRLGIDWNVAMDDEPGTTNVRDSTFQLVYSSGFTQYNYVGQGTKSRSIDERRANLASVNALYEPPVPPASA